MARGFRSVRGGRSQRRETAWISVPDVAASLGAGISVLTGSLNAAALALRPFTIVRVRGWIHCRSDQVAANENVAASWGYAVVSDQASAIGVTAVPTPITDRGSDLFFVYESMFTRFQVSSAVGWSGDFGIQRQFESKAMRKVNEDEDVVLTVENSALSGDGIVTSDGGRILLKLH